MRGAYLFLLGCILVGCGGDIVPLEPEKCLKTPRDPTTGARIFAVQPRIAPEHFDSYESYQAHLIGLIRTHVAPCRVSKRPNVIVFPENTGLSAGFVGSRGEAARSSSSAFAAFLALGGQYATPIQFYKNKWPDVSLPTQIELGITDTVWRAFHETNQLIAQEMGAWVVASTNVSAKIERSTDPAEMAALADPDLGTSAYVYVARDPAVYNTAFVYSPDGSLVTERRKPYLVAAEENDFALAKGALKDALPVMIDSFEAGIFTSKDAWMPDMVDRMAALGTEVFLQPEAFSGWTIPESSSEPNAWSPDILSQSAMAAVRKHSSYRNAVVSHLTGNLFDMVFDGQSIIVGDGDSVNKAPAYVGQQNEDFGVMAVAPWVVPDPIQNDPTQTLDARRTALRAVGQTLLPAGARENQYVETVIVADINPAASFSVVQDGPAGALGPSRTTSDNGQSEQSHPAVAWADTSAMVLAYQEGPRDATRILVTTSEDEGNTFSPPRAVTSSQNVQITPAVHVSGIYVYAAWQERDANGARIACAVSADRGKTFGAPTFLPTETTAADSWKPTFASANGQVYLAYVDGSSGNERIIVGRAAQGTVNFAISIVEPTKPHPAGDNRNNQWSPAIAANGNQLAVAWVDFRNANWDVFIARSTDGGMTFTTPVRVDDGSDALERLHDDASLAFVPNTNPPNLAVAWSDVRLRNRYASPRVSLVAGSVVGQSRRFGTADASALLPRIATLGAGNVAVVWQDDRAGGNDIYLSTSADGAVSFGTEKRIDDGGDGPSFQTAPVIASNGVGRVIVAWEDTRTGTRRIRFVVGQP